MEFKEDTKQDIDYVKSYLSNLPSIFERYNNKNKDIDTELGLITRKIIGKYR